MGRIPSDAAVLYTCRRMKDRSSLSILLSRTRRDWRAARARSAAAWTLLASAGVMSIVTLIGSTTLAVGLCSMGVAVVLSGLLGWLWRVPSDGAVAQFIDQRLDAHDLLATGVACRSIDDAIARSILAQAKAFAAKADRSRLVLSAFPSRVEIVACLAVVAWMSLTQLVDGTDATVRSETLLSTSQPDSAMQVATEDRHVGAKNVTANAKTTPPRRFTPVEREMKSPPVSENRAEGNNGTRDQSGDAAATSDSRAVSLAMPRVQPADESEARGGSEGIAAGRGRVERKDDALSPGGMETPSPNARVKIDLATDSLPDRTSREAADVAIRAGRVSSIDLDLIRAYFDLDEVP